jgi:hypothetical protein
MQDQKNALVYSLVRLFCTIIPFAQKREIQEDHLLTALFAPLSPLFRKEGPISPMVRRLPGNPINL